MQHTLHPLYRGGIPSQEKTFKSSWQSIYYLPNKSHDSSLRYVIIIT